MRHHPDFVNAFLEYTENSESAERLRLWAAIATVASALERRTPLVWGHTVLYPNLYTVIVAPSGARKGEPMLVARDLMAQAGVILTAERITDEAMLRFVADSQSNYTDNEGAIRIQSAVTIVGEELSVLIRNQDIAFLADLTALYDCREKWKYQTKGAGTDHIEGGCLNLLVSTAPDWLPTIFPPEAVGGGFTSRCFFVVEERKGKIVADPNLTMPDPEKRRKLIADLEEVAKLSGNFTLTKEGYDFYIDWYTREEEKALQGELPVRDPKLANYCSRRATHLKKLGMVLSASRGSSLKIDHQDLQRALNMMEDIEKNMSAAFKTIGHSKHAVVIEEILNILKINRVMSKAELMRLVQRDLDLADFTQVEIALREMKYIKRDESPSGIIFRYLG